MILLHLNRKVWWIHYKITAGGYKDISKFQNELYTASIFTTKMSSTKKQVVKHLKTQFHLPWEKK